MKLFFDRVFADAFLGTAFLLLLFLEIFFELHEKVVIYCTASRSACPRNWWNSELVHEIRGNQCSMSRILVEFTMCPQNWWNFQARLVFQNFAISAMYSNMFIHCYNIFPIPDLPRGLGLNFFSLV